MEQSVDGQLFGRDRIGNAIDQERHVVVDDADAHAAIARFPADGFDGQGKFARLAARSERGKELRGAAFGLSAQTLGFTRERVSRQRFSD